MAVEFEDVTDQARLEKAVANVGEILRINPDTIQNYLVLADDGTAALKAETDIDQVEEVIAIVMVFLEHISGMKVNLVEDRHLCYPVDPAVS